MSDAHLLLTLSVAIGSRFIQALLISMDPSLNPELMTMAALAECRPSRMVKEGETVFGDGDPGDSLYGVVGGQIELRSDAGCVEIIGPGSCFGAAALLNRDHRRFGTATALADTLLLEMDREEFLFALQELPMFALEILHDLESRLQRLKSQRCSG